jgi:regulator of sigma E protease
VYAETTVDEQGRPTISKLELIERATSNKRPAGSEARIFDAFENSARPTSPPPDNDRPTLMVDALVRPTEYSINWIPLGGYVRMVGEEDPTDPGSFASKSKRVRLAVLAAGSLMNLVAAVIFFTLTAMSGVPEPVTGINAAGEEAVIAQTIVREVVPNTPAADAGLQVDDVIFGADEAEFQYIGDLVDYIDNVKGQETVLHIQRGDEVFEAALVPRENPPEGQGSMGVRIDYVDVDSERIVYSLPEAAAWGATKTAQYVGLTFYFPTVILSEINLEESEKTIPTEAARPTGPVGIFFQIAGAVESAIFEGWWFPVLWLTAVLSTALAITNLLPLPALDGGRILFVIIEAIRGRRISPEKEGAIHFIGLALLLTLMLVISYYDVSNPIPTIDWGNLF